MRILGHISSPPPADRPCGLVARSFLPVEFSVQAEEPAGIFLRWNHVDLFGLPLAARVRLFVGVPD